MNALIIYCEADFTETMTQAACAAIARQLPSPKINMDAVIISKHDLAKILIVDHQPGTEFIVGCAANHVNNDIKEIATAMEFVITNYGNPLDSENAFRARLNKDWYFGLVSKGEKMSIIDESRHKRLESCVKIFALYAVKKPTKAVREMISENGLAFMPDYCNNLIRFKDM